MNVVNCGHREVAEYTARFGRHHEAFNLDTLHRAQPNVSQESPSTSYSFDKKSPALRWSEPRHRRRLRRMKKVQRYQHRRRQESSVLSAIYRYPIVDDPIAESFVSKLVGLRTSAEVGWALDEELHRWFRHKDEAKKLDAMDQCCCCELADWLYPNLERFAEGDE